MHENGLQACEKFIRALKDNRFEGDISTDKATRLVGSTDNSIYWVEPRAIIFPKNLNALKQLIETAYQFKIPLTARGGGTGTNGQSLTQFVVVDVSRYMNQIVSFDESAQTVTVEPGVVLDQLNAFLGQYGYFFPPTVSTSSRATLGGMFATDASGKGSRRYGRTSDYIVQAKVFLPDATEVDVGDGKNALESAVFIQLKQDVGEQLSPHRKEIVDVFPQMNRGLTGYNLLETQLESGQVNLIKLLAGSEGTLAITGELTLKVIKKPPVAALTVIAYDDCLQALAHVPDLLAADPVAIEFLDDRIIELASQTPLWKQIESFFEGLGQARGFLFVEFTGSDRQAIEIQQQALNRILADKPGNHIGVAVTNEPEDLAALWKMRKLSVGLLAAAEGGRIGVPFVEDAAVPPENLVDFVRDFRAILEKHDLRYGMFGHADVGCVHVRPMLDMRLQNDRDLIRTISDAIADLAQHYRGLIWGEHGKGVRGEYIQQYVGDELYALMGRIKAAFDPENLFNPGKLVTPEGVDAVILKIDKVDFRGQRDQQIDQTRFSAFEKSVACNGNGACFNWAPNDPMCPSYKVTLDRVQGPKGRATLFREWNIARSQNAERNAIDEIEKALFNSLETCLSCKSCTGQCPVSIDIPNMKSEFLDHYFSNRARSPRDYIVRHMESFSLIAGRYPRVANLLVCNRLSSAISRKLFKISDIPGFSTRRAEDILNHHDIPIVRPGNRDKLGQKITDNTVCLVLDSFVGLYQTEILDAYIDLLKLLGFKLIATPVIRNGKALHVRGFKKAYTEVKRKTVQQLNQIAELEVPMISLAPAVTNVYMGDYRDSEMTATYSIINLDQFLFANLEKLSRHQISAKQQPYSLFLHCTEKTADPESGARWQAVFKALGLDLDVIQTGCCGMAGLFGHETEHLPMSKQLFDLSWKQAIIDGQGRALVTGFSCRSQIKRLLGVKASHPAQLLHQALNHNP